MYCVDTTGMTEYKSSSKNGSLDAGETVQQLRSTGEKTVSVPSRSPELLFLVLGVSLQFLCAVLLTACPCDLLQRLPLGYFAQTAKRVQCSQQLMTMVWEHESPTLLPQGRTNAEVSFMLRSSAQDQAGTGTLLEVYQSLASLATLLCFPPSLIGFSGEYILNKSFVQESLSQRLLLGNPTQDKYQDCHNYGSHDS